MDKRTCTGCGFEFTPTHGRQRCCSPQCRKPSHAKVEKLCDWCGASCFKYRGQQRYAGTYCGRACRDAAIRLDGEGSCALPDDHWGRWYGATSTWSQPESAPAPRPSFVSNQCDDCGTPFTEPNYGTPSAYCGMTCTRRASKRRRRAREHAAPGEFTSTQLVAQYLRQGKACAYCKRPSRGLPEPDHVLPLSRGGRNDMSNIVASCRACNTDKSDLTLSEWATSRAARNLPARDTTLLGREYINLVHSTPSRMAWRDRAA